MVRNKESSEIFELTVCRSVTQHLLNLDFLTMSMKIMKTQHHQKIPLSTMKLDFDCL